MKTIINVIAFTVLVSSCSKTVKEIHTTSSMPNTLKSDDNSKINLLNDLLNSKAPNLALADLLSRTLGENRRESIYSIVGELTSEEARRIISRLQKKNEMIKNSYLFHGENYQQNDALVKSSLLNLNEGHKFQLADQLKVATFNYLKSKHLEEIILAFDKRASELSNDLAVDLAIEIGEGSSEIANIEKLIRDGNQEEAIKAIEKTKEFMTKADEYFKKSNLNENEQYAVVASGIIALGIYELVKNKDGFQKLLAESKKVIRDVKEIKRKAKEFTVLIGALKKHFKDTEKNMSDLANGMSGVGKDLNEMYHEARITNVGPTNIHSKRIFNFLYKKVIKGEDADPNESNESILSKQGKINANLQKSVEATGNLADNLSNIIGTANKLSMLFGIKPSSDLQKLMDKAQKVSQLAETAKNVMAGWMSGGALGAVTALSVSPIPGLGGGKSADAAKLKEISRKLDIVLKNQQKIMEMQIETMNMIKNLALLIDQYHQEEMRALSELREIGLVNLEMNKALQNKDLRNCERMVNFQLRSVWSRFDFQKDSFHSVGQISLIKSKFVDNIYSLEDIQRIVTSVEESGFANCQTGLSEAFGGNSTAENPVRIIYESDEDNILTKFQKERYLPLLEFFGVIMSQGDINTIPLHIPAANMTALKFKTPYVDFPNERSISNESHYDLDYLISVKNLERYLGYLLLVYPLLEVDKPTWMQSLQEIISQYLKSSNSQTNQNVRSHFFLNNALRLVQSAISQEAILAGEPIIQKLHDLYFNEILNTESCDKVVLKDTPASEYPLLCSIRGNKLLMKNLIHYALSYKIERDPQALEEYTIAYKQGNISKLALMMSAKLNSNRIKYIQNENDGSFSLSVTLENNKQEDIRLPTPEEIKADKIIYSENMSRLIIMQEAVLEALANVAPISRDNSNFELLKLMMVNN